MKRSPPHPVTLDKLGGAQPQPEVPQTGLVGLPHVTSQVLCTDGQDVQSAVALIPGSDCIRRCGVPLHTNLPEITCERDRVSGSLLELSNNTRAPQSEGHSQRPSSRRRACVPGTTLRGSWVTCSSNMPCLQSSRHRRGRRLAGPCPTTPRTLPKALGAPYGGAAGAGHEESFPGGFRCTSDTGLTWATRC